MTKCELKTMNKKLYEEHVAKVANMEDGIEKMVAEHLILKWIKGSDWLGGLSDKAFEEVYAAMFAPLGYTVDEVINEFERQMAGC